MFKKKLWALIFCLILTPNISLANASPKLAVNFDARHSRNWYPGETLKINWQILDIPDKKLIQAEKTLVVINEAGTMGWPLPAGNYNLQKIGTYNWIIPQDITPGKYRILFDVIIPGTWPYQAESELFQIKSSLPRTIDITP